MLLNIANIALMLSAAAGVVGRPLDHVTVAGQARNADGAVVTNTIATVNTMNNLVPNSTKETAAAYVHTHRKVTNWSTLASSAPTDETMKGAGVNNSEHGGGRAPATTPAPLRIAVPEGTKAVSASTSTTPTGLVTITRPVGAAPTETSTQDKVKVSENMSGDGDSPLHETGGAADLDAASSRGFQTVLDVLPSWGKDALIIWGAIWAGLWLISSIRNNGFWPTIDRIVQAANPLQWFRQENAQDPTHAPAPAPIVLRNNEGQNDRGAQGLRGYRNPEYAARNVFVQNGDNFNFRDATPGEARGFVQAVRLSRDNSSAGGQELVDSPRHSIPLEPAPEGAASIPAERPSQAQSVLSQDEVTGTQDPQVMRDSAQTEATPLDVLHIDIDQAEAPFADEGPNDIRSL